MTIRIPTLALVGMLADLALTAADPADSDATAGVLLHTVRGHANGEPGRSDLLVGTSTTGVLIGHCWTTCAGQLPAPTLWHVNDVRATLAMLKPLAKEKEHTTRIDVGDRQVEVAEDLGTLPGMGDSLTLSFGPLDVEDWPMEGVHAQLTALRMSVKDKPAVPRTTMTSSRLAPFLKVASRRNDYLEVYRYHQSLPVHVQVGGGYRGVISPVPDDERPGEQSPWGDVYPPQRPAEVDAA